MGEPPTLSSPSFCGVIEGEASAWLETRDCKKPGAFAEQSTAVPSAVSLSLAPEAVQRNSISV